MIAEEIKQRIEKQTELIADFIETDNPKDMYMANIFITIMEEFINE